MVPRGLCKLRTVIHNKTLLLTGTGRSFQSTLGIEWMACEYEDSARAEGKVASSSLCFAPTSWGLLPNKRAQQSDSAAAVRRGYEGSVRWWSKRHARDDWAGLLR